jgi:cell wall-associated NlpC family hydrolase
MSKHLETSEAQFGDLVFFITRGNGISHVGIYLGNNQFIHSPGKGRFVSIDSLNAGYYKNHLVGFGSVL